MFDIVVQSLWIIGYITYRLKETISNLTSKNKNIQTNSSKTYNWNREIKNYVDPPNFWNPTLGLFFGGYFLAFLSIWQFFLFFKDPPTPETSPLPPHDALPIFLVRPRPSSSSSVLVRSLLNLSDFAKKEQNLEEFGEIWEFWRYVKNTSLLRLCL